MGFLILVLVSLAVLYLVKVMLPDSKVAGFINCAIDKLNKKNPPEAAAAKLAEEAVAEPETLAAGVSEANGAETADLSEQAKPVEEAQIDAKAEPTAEPQFIAASVVEAKVEASEEPTSPVTASDLNIPEDSVLRRHYLSKLAAELEALWGPYPTDSILRRHYEHLHKK